MTGVDRLLYNTVISQIFSPCGHYLIAGNLYGHIAVFDLQLILNPGDNATNISATKPIYVFETQNCEPVNSLSSSGKFLVVGTVGEITGYDWKSVIPTKHRKISWNIQIPSSKDTLEKVDVNSLVVNENINNDQILIAGCGDNKLHIFSLKDGKHITSLEGHDDYIHSVNSIDSHLVSSGEDGKVCLWDIRQSTKTGQIEPHLKDNLARPHLGKWIGDAVMNSDWLVCGGGPCLSLWHLRSMEMLTKFSTTEDNGINVCRFYDDRILAGGTSPYFYHLSVSGDVYVQLETSALTVYSVAFQDTPNQVMCLAGSSRNIDLCTNFSYRDQILTFEEPDKST
ncbi:THO complex subunit 6 [Lycorma delicatula]|uniref:THO complex subunit 6 n=1 Tax=Lycorma delicatula TaxID=130591 RepID=UPI003F50FD35